MTSVKKIYPDLLSGGWEIGLHGSYLSYDDYSLLVKEKTLLEDAIESPVFGGSIFKIWQKRPGLTSLKRDSNTIHRRNERLKCLYN